MENLCPESCLLIVVGIILGVITYFSSDQNEIIEFDAHLFFTVILPPIIMEAGYFIPARAFFDQLGTILLHAIVATLVKSRNVISMPRPNKVDMHDRFRFIGTGKTTVSENCPK